LVEHPYKYRWNSLGYHVQTGNEDTFLSLDFGLKEFSVLDAEERLKRYRRYVYEAGAVDRSERQLAPVPSSGATRQAVVIDNRVLQKERENPA
jgi:hypothetical protein